MDKVRFSLGVDVFQGYHDGDYGMVGALVFVTANTLREVEALMAEQMTTDFDKLHNGPEGMRQTLAFGGGGVLSSEDGVTVIYPLMDVEPSIVQRFDPTLGRFGQWVNVDTLDGYFGGQPDWEPVFHGFVIDAEGWARGVSDAPPIDTEAARAVRESAPKKVWVVSVKVEMSDGTDFEVEQSPHEHEGGTSYSGHLPPAARELEDAINVAINELNLYPDADPSDGGAAAVDGAARTMNLRDVYVGVLDN